MLRSTIFTALLFSSAAFAHSGIVGNGDLAPRSPRTSLKTAPCGGIARGTTPAVHKRGSTIQVKWKETIDHPGRFEFYLSPGGDTGFVLLKTVDDTQNGEDDLPHFYQTDLTLPDVACADCTLQMIQVMTEDPSKPKNYYSCADLSLTR